MPIALYRQNISGYSIREVLFPNEDTDALFKTLLHQRNLLKFQVHINNPMYSEGFLISVLNGNLDDVNATLLMCGVSPLQYGSKMLLINIPLGSSESDLLNTLVTDGVNLEIKEAKIRSLTK